MKTTATKPAKPASRTRKTAVPKTPSPAVAPKRVIDRFAGLMGSIRILDMKAVLK